MANEQVITIRGRLTSDPELKFGPSGVAIASFTIASNARKFNRQSNEFEDKDAIFWRCTAWREMAESVAESLTKGVAVVALAELESRSYETREGEKRTVTEAKIEAIGPDLRWATAKVTKSQRSNTANNSGFGNSQPANNGFGGQQQDPWNAAPVDSGNWGAPSDGPAF